MRPRRMPKAKMQQLGSYRPPQANVPGRYNLPRRGRVGKAMPSMKRMGPVRRRGR